MTKGYEIPQALRTPPVMLSERIDRFVPNETVMQSISERKMLYVGRDDKRAVFVAWMPLEDSINVFHCPLDQHLERGTERLEKCTLIESYRCKDEDHKKYRASLKKNIPQKS